MKILLSPAKLLNENISTRTGDQANFLEKSQTLIDVLKSYSPQKISKIMKLSTELSNLNYNRYQNWKKSHTSKNSTPTALLYNGPAYKGLDFGSLTPKEQDYATVCLRILSGLYGILSPLDLIQPHRLEMGTRLDISPDFKNLYDFWRPLLTQQINDEFANDKTPLIVNLASSEYAKAIDWKNIKVPVVECVFMDRTKSGDLKVVMAYAKRARGLMARYIIQNKATQLNDLRSFNEEGYKFTKTGSNETILKFIREQFFLHERPNL